MVFGLTLAMLNVVIWANGAEALPEGGNGIAAKYPGDKGIEKDPSIIFVEKFDSHLRALG